MDLLALADFNLVARHGGFGRAVWALYPSRRLQSARVTAFLDYLKAAFLNGTPDELAAYLPA